MKRVLTLTPDTFAEHCRRLEAECAGYAPDLIVGIPTGGKYVAESMFAAVPHILAGARRPSTKMKRGVVARLLKHLPLKVADLLRIAEAQLLRHTDSRRALPAVELPAAQAAQIAGKRRILVVDDACDSGLTLAAVDAAIRRCAGADAEIRSAVITVTTPSPRVVPDHALYRNTVLVRFPWSADARY